MLLSASDDAKLRLGGAVMLGKSSNVVSKLSARRCLTVDGSQILWISSWCLKVIKGWRYFGDDRYGG